jgi:hypothetical protein
MTPVSRVACRRLHAWPFRIALGAAQTRRYFHQQNIPPEQLRECMRRDAPLVLTLPARHEQCEVREVVAKLDDPM